MDAPKRRTHRIVWIGDHMPRTFAEFPTVAVSVELADAVRGL
jgi:hypothetical protein